jgi:hypothetical protein
MTDQLIYLNASGMRPETIAMLKKVISRYEGCFRWEHSADHYKAKADLAVEILEMEGIKDE